MKTRWFKRFAATAVAIAAMMSGQTAWADPTFQVGVGILGKTDGQHSYYVIASNYISQGEIGPITGVYGVFKNTAFTIGNNDVPVTMTLNGDVLFAESSSYTDVTVLNTHGFEIAFTSTTRYFTGASVATKDGTTVTGCTVTGTYSRTLTVTIPKNASFGSVTLTVATHTPLSQCTISGIEDSYIDDGVNQPVPTVTLDGRTLTKDVDYTVSYTIGGTSGTVKVTGTGDYLGEKTQRFGIRQPALTDLNRLSDGAYEISSQRDLDYLARIVNGTGTQGNSCSGLTFRQTADIAYNYTTAWDYESPFVSNFTPIGGYGKSFGGTYDGQGHSISGIRVYSSGNGDADSSKGLFGYLYGGTVKNVILTDSQFLGYQNIGGLVGYNEGTVSDCYLYHVATNSTYRTDSQGIIAGYQGSNGSAVRTHYRDCKSFNMGSHAGFFYGQTSIYTLTTAADVTLSARTGGSVVNSALTTYPDGITLDGTEYYAPGSVVSLTYDGTVPAGCWPRFTATSGGDDKTAEVIDGSTLTMRRYDVVVSCSEFLPIVSYIDGDGCEQECSYYTPITGSDGGVSLSASAATRWYVVSSDATISGTLTISGTNVRLILCDGATLSLTRLDVSRTLTIYGQQQGTGKLNAEVTPTNPAISTGGDITILGGIVSATSASGYGIDAESHTVTLGWSSPANRIYASGKNGAYNCSTLQVKSGQTLWNGTEALSGTITDMSKVDGKTLRPYINEGETTRTLTARRAGYAGQTRYWATFYHPYWNFLLPAGAQAFTMGPDHALYRVGDGSVIPADCAVVVMVEAASAASSVDITLTKTDSTATPVEGNILRGENASTPASTLVTGTGNVYVMGMSGSTFGFFRFTGTTLPANKAYYVE